MVLGRKGYSKLGQYWQISVSTSRRTSDDNCVMVKEGGGEAVAIEGTEKLPQNQNVVTKYERSDERDSWEN